MSIGYEIGVSALQMATAFATIANDGVRVQPHVIKEIRQQDGQTISATEPQKTRVVTAETARGLRRMLREVVLKGTGKRAQLNGYTSSGKTGTAWKFNPKTKRIDASKYVSSFIGMAPAENPSVVIAVVMDEPKSGARDGGQVSGPVFREIAEQILPELNVIPDANIQQEDLTAEKVPTETVEVPDDVKVLDETATAQAELDKPKPEIDTNLVVSANRSSAGPKSAAVKEAKKETPQAANKEANREIKKEPKKEPKPAAKPPDADKKAVKTKTAIKNEKPPGEAKNKSSGGRTKQKT
jgi:membrane peptidoglycan carboxypeptidase